MKAVKVEIVRIIDRSQPVFVECQLIDAGDKVWSFEEKLPVVADFDLDDLTEFPQPGVIACEVLRRWQGEDDKDLVAINTDEPWHVESKEGTVDFEVLAEQIIELDACASEEETSRFLKLLDALYGYAISGVPKLKAASAAELADEYSRGDDPIDKKIERLIRYQDAKSFTTGFLTGLGGIITLPVSVPADVAVVLFVQLRMVAAIAMMRGLDPTEDRVKTLCYVAMAGKGAQEIVREVGITIGKKLVESQIRKISGAALTKINQKVGFRLVTKFGQKGAINLGRMIPLAGGVIGGTADLVSTHTVGKTAKAIFQI